MPASTRIQVPAARERSSAWRKLALTPPRDVNWRRVFAAASLVMAFLLICGSIVLHVRHKHHFGRMHHATSSFIVAPKPSPPPPSPPAADATDADAHTIAGMEPSLTVATQPPRHHIDVACMRCICETATRCQSATCGQTDDSCGIFRISRPYWLDGGKLTADLPCREPLMDGTCDDGDGYLGCVNNVECARRTVAGFIKRYARDCNHDGRIDCQDHIALHVLGPSGCLVREMPEVFQNRMVNCLANL